MPKKVKPAEMTIWLQCHAECQGAAFIPLFTQCAFYTVDGENVWQSSGIFKRISSSINYCKEFWNFQQVYATSDNDVIHTFSILIQLIHFNDNFLIAT